MSCFHYTKANQFTKVWRNGSGHFYCSLEFTISGEAETWLLGSDVVACLSTTNDAALVLCLIHIIIDEVWTFGFYSYLHCVVILYKYRSMAVCFVSDIDLHWIWVKRVWIDTISHWLSTLKKWRDDYCISWCWPAVNVRSTFDSDRCNMVLPLWLMVILRLWRYVL